MSISVVVPILNESQSLPQLHRELSEVAGEQQLDLEIIFVDDGSSDGSWSVIEQLAQQDTRVRGIRFRRNFGKAAALSAGFAEVSGERVLTLDADLQDDPHEIPRFLEELERQHLDVVSGWKRMRYDPWHKVAPSRVFNWLVSWLTGVRLHDHNCGFKCYRREVLDEVDLYGELHRFVPVLAAARGFRVGEIEVHHRARRHGQSKYGLERFAKGLLDLFTVYFLTGFRHRPQHLLGAIGLTSFLLGLCGIGYLSGYWVAARIWPDWELLPLHQRPALIYSLGALLLGAQMLSIGFLAELLTAQRGSARTYSVQQRVNPGHGTVDGGIVPGDAPQDWSVGIAEEADPK